MCLSTKMSPKKKAEFKEQTKGWKVLWHDANRGLLGDNYSLGQIRPQGERLNEADFRDSHAKRPSYDDCKEYPYGWHIWLTLEGARDWVSAPRMVIRKVEFRKPVAYGYQREHPVVVAKEMMILKEAQ